MLATSRLTKFYRKEKKQQSRQVRNCLRAYDRTVLKFSSNEFVSISIILVIIRKSLGQYVPTVLKGLKQ